MQAEIPHCGIYAHIYETHHISPGRPNLPTP
jgi:hypothetical protein